MCKVVHTIWPDWKRRLHQSTTFKQNPGGWWIFLSAQEAIEWGITGRAFHEAFTLESELCIRLKQEFKQVHSTLCYRVEEWVSAIISPCVWGLILQRWKTCIIEVKYIFRCHRIGLILTHTYGVAQWRVSVGGQVSIKSRGSKTRVKVCRVEENKEFVPANISSTSFF